MQTSGLTFEPKPIFQGRDGGKRSSKSAGQEEGKDGEDDDGADGMLG